MSVEDWNRMILAPLIRVSGSASAGRQVARQFILNAARERELLDERGGKSGCAELVDGLRRDPDAIEAGFSALSPLIENLPEDLRRSFASDLYEAAFRIAEASPGPDGWSIEDTEKEQLENLLRTLGLMRGGTSPATPPRKPAPDRPPHRIAAALDDGFFEQAFEHLGSMHSIHEAEWARGKGRLDGIRCLDELKRPSDQAWVDEGVLVMPESDGQATYWVVGDLHGDYASLEKTLERSGFATGEPPAGSHLIFVGDYGDRGSQTLAVWLRIAELKASHPDQVFLLRGNHEEVEPVRLLRQGSESPLKKLWQVPTTTNMEAYLGLTSVLLGNLDNLAMVYSHLPDVAILPGNLFVVHGCLPPTWKEEDGWSRPEEDKDPLRIDRLADLRKPRVRQAIRWTDLMGQRESVSHAWSNYSHAASRLFCARSDLAHWMKLLGDFKIIHGHTHPREGAVEEAEGQALALNSSRLTAPKQAIARIVDGRWEAIEI